MSIKNIYGTFSSCPDPWCLFEDLCDGVADILFRAVLGRLGESGLVAAVGVVGRELMLAEADRAAAGNAD
jgi:hypothetical protein